MSANLEGTWHPAAPPPEVLHRARVTGEWRRFGWTSLWMGKVGSTFWTLHLRRAGERWEGEAFRFKEA